MAPTGAFPPNKSAGLSARSCVTSLAHEAILWAIFFAPAGHRLNVFVSKKEDTRVHFCPQQWLLCHLCLY